MSNNNTSAQIDGQIKQQILQAAQDEMARYEKDLKDQAAQEQKGFDLSTILILLLLFVLACGLIVSFAWRPLTTAPSSTTQQQQAN
jgi:Flp pilus assembly protein TadB